MLTCHLLNKFKDAVLKGQQFDPWVCKSLPRKGAWLYSTTLTSYIAAENFFLSHNSRPLLSLHIGFHTQIQLYPSPYLRFFHHRFMTSVCSYSSESPKLCSVCQFVGHSFPVRLHVGRKLFIAIAHYSLRCAYCPHRVSRLDKT